MTIEIRELVIRAVTEARPAGAPRNAEPARPAPPRAEPQPALSAEEREALVARCVREVLRELKKSRGR